MKKTINRKAEITYTIEFDDYVEFEVEGLLFDLYNINKQLAPQFKEVLEQEYNKYGVDILDVAINKFIDYQQPEVNEETVKIKVKKLEITITIDPHGQEVEISDMVIKDEDIFTSGIQAVIIFGFITATALFGWLSIREIRLTVEKIKLLDPNELSFLEQLMTKGSIGLIFIGFIFWLIYKWFKGGDRD